MPLLTFVGLIRVLRALLVALVGLALVAVMVRQVKLLDRQLVFFPSKHVLASPSDVGLPFEDVSFRTSDGVMLNGWFVPGDGNTTLLWFHGNAGNVGDRVDNILLLNNTVGVNVFIFDYRGYGLSEGSPSENGMYLDAEAAIAYLKTRPDVNVEEDLILFGRSIGAAVAVEMGTRRDFRGIILESPFTSLKDMARWSHPVLSRLVPVSLLLNSRYESLAKIPLVTSPFMVIHGEVDQTVPPEMGVELFDEANEPKRLYMIEGAHHNDTYIAGGNDYFESLKSFIGDQRE
ncbi:MAG: alpha/beta hydrolase [Chloroflexi bacterium]|nr:alpha/beta hydrolase [Chloroflexota bacterium]MDA1228504.1 alpha/beta hydrolase [Chloroflexota bacterium]